MKRKQMCTRILSNRINNFKLHTHRILVKLCNVIAKIINYSTGPVTTVNLLKNTKCRYISNAEIVSRIVRHDLHRSAYKYAYMTLIGDVALRPQSSGFSCASTSVCCD
jgi:hypothetical protein